MKSYIRIFILSVICISNLARAGGKDTYKKQMTTIENQYLSIQELLANDNFKGVNHKAHLLYKSIQHVDDREIKGKDRIIYKNIKSDIKKYARSLSNSKSLDSARNIFKKLSEPMIAWVNLSKNNTLDIMYCPMKKAGWVQSSGATRNPYYGKSMLRCGSKK